jgi:hypothetical protein
VNEKVDVMSTITIGLDQTEEETLTYEVSDEALEIAGSEKAGNYITLGFCTGLVGCPT